jgi:uncharacterized membrane protein
MTTGERGERVVGWAYRLSLAIAGPLLLAGLVTGATPLLQAGVLVLMATPLVGVILVAGAMAAARDWPFTAVALVVLAILGSSLYAAAHLTRPAAAAAPRAPAAR